MNINIKNCTYAILIIGVLFSGLTNVVSAETPKFLSFPFTDSDIKLQQGWVYDFSTAKHQGIDYIKNWQAFDVKAAADGEAIYIPNHRTWGNYVKIKHIVGTSTYYTLYAHLASSPLQANKWVPVTRGMKIGVAGKTGDARNVIHLHFEFSKTTAPPNNRLDPYDIYSTKNNYPPYKPNGPNNYWTNSGNTKLLRVNGIDVHYINSNGQRARVYGPGMFSFMHFSWADVKDVSEQELMQYPEAYPWKLTFPDYTFIMDETSGQISMIEFGTRHWLTSWESYIRHNGDPTLSNVVRCSTDEYYNTNAAGNNYD
ncbi:MAG: M23 family metallopeptidase [Methanosarcina sp.]